MQPFVFFVSVYSMELPAQKFIRAVQKNCQLLLPCGGDCTGKTHAGNMVKLELSDMEKFRLLSLREKGSTVAQ